MELLDSKVAYAGHGVHVEVRLYRRADSTEVERQVIHHVGLHDDEEVSSEVMWRWSGSSRSRSRRSEWDQPALQVRAS